MLQKKNNKKGFTLAELLIVVAIIGVLVAISIPVFTSQLEKAREATDAANIRAAYAEVMTAALTEDTTTSNDESAVQYTAGDNGGASWSKSVDLKQNTDGWQNENNKTGLEGAGMVIEGNDNVPKKGGRATVTYTNTGDGTDGTVTVTFVDSNG